MRLAIVGFRHGHVGSLYAKAQELDYVDIVACVEEDPAARDTLARDLGVTLTHETFDEVLNDVEFDALACVDYYAKRGPTIIKALEAGKHCITDKPLCTEIDQLERIAGLSREKNLTVHVALTMRYSPEALAFRQLVQDGAIGDPVSATVFGHHPLAWGSRPGWYFEEGKQRGTINDLMIHGIDMMRWVTGNEFSRVITGDASSFEDSPAPEFFQQSAQCFLEMTNGARVFADASYLVPDGHHAPWRFFVWGSQGHIHYESGSAPVVEAAGKPTVTAELGAGPGLDAFEDFARQVEFGDEPFLAGEECFRSTMAALTAQKAADTGEKSLPVTEI